MRKNWKRGAAALLSAVLTVSGVFSAGVVYADKDLAMMAAEEAVIGPGAALDSEAALAQEREGRIATASDASVSGTAKEKNSEASASDALYDEDGTLLDGELLFDLEATASDAALAAVADGLILSDLEIEDDTEIFYFDEPFDNNELFSSYVDKVFEMEEEPAPARRLMKAVSARANLGNSSQKLFDALENSFESVATGTLESTVFAYDAETVGTERYYSAEELGVTSLVTGNTVNSDAKAALLKKYGLNIGLTLDALRKDVPYYMYWVDYSGSSISYSYSMNSEGKLRFETITIYVPVAEAFRGSGINKADTEKTSATVAAKNNADDIVREINGSSLTDLKKLIAYRDRIMDLVTYNHTAAANGTGTSESTNPWQMIYVFDNIPDTNVVCEGYSKAFKYLCDHTEFSGDVSCYIMTGTYSQQKDNGVSKEGHMWNAVSINGKNYLADITHCDSYYDGSAGVSGFGDERFLIGVTMKSGFSGFTIENTNHPVKGDANYYYYGGTVTYDYYHYNTSGEISDDSMMTLYTEAERTLSPDTYSFPVEVYSAATDGSTSVANLRGGGTVYPSRLTGEGEATLVAAEKSGYQFLGWYEYNDQTAVGNISGADPVTLNVSDIVTVEDKAKFVAVYEKEDDAAFSLTVKGESFTVNGTAAEKTYTGSFGPGSQITLVFNGDNFAQWSTGEGVQLSTNRTYTFNLTGNTVISAENAASGSSLVRFVTHSGQTIVSGQWTLENADDKYTVAAGYQPAHNGYTFTGWSMSLEEVKAAIQSGTKVITVEPVYEKETQTYTITRVLVGDGFILNETSPVSYSGRKGTYVTIQARNLTDKRYIFQYWALDQQGTEILSYSPNYSYGITGDATVYAIYERKERMKSVPVISVESGGKAKYGDYDRYTYTFRMEIPAAYTIIDAGLLYNNKGTAYSGSDEKAFQLDSEAARVSIGIPDTTTMTSSDSGTTGSRQGSFTARVMDRGKGVKVRGYVQVQSEEFGIQAYYTAIVEN